MNILFVGDIFGSPGREALKYFLPQLIDRYVVDFTVVNVDNAAGGKGITDKIADELFQLPIDCMTAGNHVWEQKSILTHLETHPILRPHNVVGHEQGKGFGIFASRSKIPVAVIHLQGKVFMEGKGKQGISPFRAADELLGKISAQCSVILVDIHAEATAEKKALAYYLDGRVSAVVGTHTHVQTADEQILPKGSAYITDLGMTGPHASVIGLDIETALKRFLSDGTVKDFKVATEGARLEGLLVHLDEKTGRAGSVKRICEYL